jgi:dihydropteroate synthase
VGDHDRARVERRQSAEVSLVAFDRDNCDAASDECADRIYDASAGIVDPAQKGIVRRDAGAHNVSSEAKGQRQGDRERREYALMVDVARRAAEPTKYAEKLGTGIADYAGQQADGEYGPDPY